ncbi:succinylglutamate desuccinylase/aspartoacylase family protein [Rhodohalobacter sp. 614A]|uniref:succinylglutamate desuccinylase/aspartoacylase family protein n=1 Tax=Rhodohalobacter sp. 614A TaxID=2908649 RepID=UPI001F1D372E|nr:succinylglutamate desuccinylase/aspartoacylase family protein [Rhodohalobacter sp. 614A]
MQKTEPKQQQEKKVERIRWSKSGNKKGPVLVLFVGIHGNEPAGMYAVDRIAKRLSGDDEPINGTVYAVTGNIEAVKLGIRFLDTDLNRLWERFNTSQDFSIRRAENRPAEYLESLEIKKTVDHIIDTHSGTSSDFVFIDLHTTSSQSCGFILLNDTLENRDLAKGFPVPQILGIEENIQGTLLSYINNLGFKAIGFEAGAHNAEVSVIRSEAFLWLVLDKLGIYELSEENRIRNRELLKTENGVPATYYEIVHHKIVDDPQRFEMLDGFQNFDQIEKDMPLAYEHGNLIKAPRSGRIFMPLYQKVGNDGFLIVRKVSAFWLTLSGYLRKSFFHTLLKYLPGVTQVGEHSYEVNLNVARFLVKDIFHLLGYRVTQKDEDTLICYRR